jgi:4-hydroxy-tetrahydrodipicolinate synthase
MKSEVLDLSGIWVPLVTPFKDGAIDHAALRRLVAHCIAGGVAGFVVCGSTAEPWALDDGEQDAVLRTVLDAAGALPVLMGVSGSHERRLHERVQRVSESKVAGLLMPPPYYARPSQQGLVDWFGRLADVSRKPVLLYDIPSRTGVRIEPETVFQLAAHPRIVGLKDCGGSLRDMQALVADSRLQVLAGDDAQAFATLCLGGAGAIAASAQLWPEPFVAMYRAVVEQRLADARRIAHTLAPSIELLFAEPNPAPLKAALAQLGLIEDELRAPMARASAALRAQLFDGRTAVLGRNALQTDSSVSIQGPPIRSMQ